DLVVLSGNTVVGDGDDMVIAQLDGAAKLAGQSNDRTFDWSVRPSDLGAGPYQICVKADAPNWLGELDETNNVRCAPIVIRAVLPDLVPTALTVPATADTGTVIAISFTVANQGTGPMEGSTDLLFLST